MTGETDLNILLKTMTPQLNEGEYVFCTTENMSIFQAQDIIGFFKEMEGYTIILSKEKADKLRLEYSIILSWISLTVHSSLEAVGLTAAFSGALAKANISCNVMAGYYHDHIFVAKKDAELAMAILINLTIER
jgi:uncharacterized protein